jgi:hypothetical protein
MSSQQELKSPSKNSDSAKESIAAVSSWHCTMLVTYLCRKAPKTRCLQNTCKFSQILIVIAMEKLMLPSWESFCEPLEDCPVKQSCSSSENAYKAKHLLLLT